MTPDLTPYREALIPAYVDYCSNVSVRHMAMSIESCTYLWWLCDRLRAGRVCDLGSGFTSYTLRAYRALADWPVEVVSVDDDPYWLDRTGDFLDRHGMDPDRLVEWSDWAAVPGGPYDVIVHDLGRGALRESSMWDAAKALDPAGMLLFDDAQNSSHANVMRDVCDAHEWDLVDLRRWTMDAAQRFSVLAVAS